MAKEGEKVKIHCVDCGRGLKKRLLDLGLYEGTIIKVIKNDIRGPVIVKILDSRVILGRGQAHKIMVEPLERKNV